MPNKLNGLLGVLLGLLVAYCATVIGYDYQMVGGGRSSVEQRVGFPYIFGNQGFLSSTLAVVIGILALWFFIRFGKKTTRPLMGRQVLFCLPWVWSVAVGLLLNMYQDDSFGYFYSYYLTLGLSVGIGGLLCGIWWYYRTDLTPSDILDAPIQE